MSCQFTSQGLDIFPILHQELLQFHNLNSVKSCEIAYWDSWIKIIWYNLYKSWQKPDVLKPISPLCYRKLRRFHTKSSSLNKWWTIYPFWTHKPLVLDSSCTWRKNWIWQLLMSPGVTNVLVTIVNWLTPSTKCFNKHSAW